MTTGTGDWGLGTRGSAPASRVVAALALGALALAGCNRGGDANAAEAATPAVASVGPENIAVVERAELRSGPAISGNLEPEWSATVRAEVAGSVVHVSAEQGQRVRKGEVLARLDETAIRDSYLSAQSGVRSAEMAAQVAERNAERTEKLAQAGAVAERDLEQARWSAQNARAQLADARARFALAEKQLDKTRVRAPAAGVVSARQVQAGDAVQPGGAMFTVVDPSRMKLEASVPATQLGAVRVGAPVEFAVTGYEGRTFSGVVTRINPVADPTTGQVRLTIAIPNSAGTLVGGLFAEGRVASETRTGVVAPATAVAQRGLRPSVVRIKNGRTERVEVQLGLVDERTDRVEILRGVAAGDTLLLGAAQGIAPGTAVRVAVVRDAER